MIDNENAQVALAKCACDGQNTAKAFVGRVDRLHVATLLLSLELLGIPESRHETNGSIFADKV